MSTLLKVHSKKDILREYRGTPIELLFGYHNLQKQESLHSAADLLIAMCMDNRKKMRIPENFAYIIRTGGANLRYSEFKISYAIAIGGIKAMALIAHNNCGMVGLISRKKAFIDGLSKNAGWSRKKAEEHFWNFAPMFEIDNEIDFVCAEAQRLRKKYPKILVAPLFYDLNDNLLCQIVE